MEQLNQAMILISNKVPKREVLMTRFLYFYYQFIRNNQAADTYGKNAFDGGC